MKPFSNKHIKWCPNIKLEVKIIYKNTNIIIRLFEIVLHKFISNYVLIYFQESGCYNIFTNTPHNLYQNWEPRITIWKTWIGTRTKSYSSYTYCSIHPDSKYMHTIALSYHSSLLFLLIQFELHCPDLWFNLFMAHWCSSHDLEPWMIQNVIRRQGRYNNHISFIYLVNIKTHPNHSIIIYPRYYMSRMTEVNKLKCTQIKPM